MRRPRGASLRILVRLGQAVVPTRSRRVDAESHEVEQTVREGRLFTDGGNAGGAVGGYVHVTRRRESPEEERLPIVDDVVRRRARYLEAHRVTPAESQRRQGGECECPFT